MEVIESLNSGLTNEDKKMMNETQTYKNLKQMITAHCIC